MRFLSAWSIVVAASLGLAAWVAANAVAATSQTQAVPSAQGLAVGQMKNLTLFTPPRPVADAAFKDGAGRELNLAAFRGRVVLVNLWATWCVPCRAEMPSIDRLQGALGGSDFTVVAISQDRAGAAKAQAFLDELGIKHLKLYIDDSMRSARQFGATGLPVTFILDRQGREVGRLIGPAEWDTPEAMRVIRHFVDPEAPKRTER
jgi:thiol-disulfide isomerase/thioredoxin